MQQHPHDDLQNLPDKSSPFDKLRRQALRLRCAKIGGISPQDENPRFSVVKRPTQAKEASVRHPTNS